MAGLVPRGVSVSCQCACNEQYDPLSAAAAAVSGAPGLISSSELALGAEVPDLGLLGVVPIPSLVPPDEVIEVESTAPRGLRPRHERGIPTYIAALDCPLIGPPLRVGEVWHLHREDAKHLDEATLTLYANGFEARPHNGDPTITISWSPFSLVQACRLHSVQADAALPWLRLFKISVFHHGTAHFFAARDEDESGSVRARWVADVARGLRLLTASLFPPFHIRAEPVPGAAWTSTRLVAGYLLMCDNQDVALVYCELHTHWDFAAAFAVYEDECCDTRVMRVAMGVHTCISERVGIDCSCFSVDGHHFAARSCAEKGFWLRAVSNVKVKLRHRAENPSALELQHYRYSVAESARTMRDLPAGIPQKPLLSRREPQGQNRKIVQRLQDSPPRDSSADRLPQTAKTGGPGGMMATGGLQVRRPAPPPLPRESSPGPGEAVLGHPDAPPQSQEPRSCSPRHAFVGVSKSATSPGRGRQHRGQRSQGGSDATAPEVARNAGDREESPSCSPPTAVGASKSVSPRKTPRHRDQRAHGVARVASACVPRSGEDQDDAWGEGRVQADLGN